MTSQLYLCLYPRILGPSAFCNGFVSLCFLINNHAETLYRIEETNTIKLCLFIIRSSMEKPMSIDYVRLICIKITFLIEFPNESVV